MLYWFINKSSTVWGETSTNKFYRSAYTFPFIHGGINYDKNNRVSSILMDRVESGQYAGRFKDVFIYPTSTYRYQIVEGGTRPSIKPRNYKGMSRLIISDNDLSTVDAYLTPLPTTTIMGKFRFKGNILGGFGDMLAGSCYPLSVSINGVTYNYISFSGSGDWISDENVNSGIPNNGSSIAVFNNYGEIGTTPSDYTVLTISKDSSQLQEIYYNMLWDFGDTPQETTEEFKSWLLSNTDPVYPYTCTIKDFLGINVLGSITEIPSITNASLSVVGNQKTLILTGSNGNDYILRWNSDTPNGQPFLGLSLKSNSNRAILYANSSIAVSWAGNFVLYEAYGTYQPPTTFDINLYQNSAEVNRVDKGQFLVEVGTLSGALREECSMITPSVVYQSTDIPTFNYVYIPIFNRYYYVTSLSSVSKNVWRMELKCDVLMTYKEEIRLLQGVIGRQEIDFNPLLIDNELPTQNNPIVEVIDIPSDTFNTQASDSSHNFVITVIGA